MTPDQGVSFSLSLTGEGATARLGEALASLIKPGCLILLTGELGAGKTTLARAIIRALLNEPEMDVPSPSFALVQPYEGRGLAIIHADLYRLAAAAEIQELGLSDDQDAIVLVEWAERDPSLATRADLIVTLSVANAGEARRATLSTPTGTIDLTSLSASM